MASGDGGRIIATGSILVDLSLRVPALPQVGGDVIAGPAVLEVGGGLNLISAARRQGAAIVYAGRHGTGPYGDLVRAALESVGVQALQPISLEADTGLCVTFVDDRAERSFVTSPGVEAVLSAEHLGRIAVRPADIVALSGYDLAYAGAQDALAAWVAALPEGQAVLLDPGPLLLGIPADLWAAVVSRTTVLTVNDREARLLADRAGSELGDLAIHAAIRYQHDLRPDALLVVRHGPLGCSYTDAADRPPTRVPSIAVAAVDTTGAGDTHSGVLLAELRAGTSTYAALRRANVAAAVSVTRAGPATAPSRSEIDERLGSED
jgi:sugar/nucleoside kinase (ribokinase family)